jgi:hypothetical protein
MSMNKSLQGAGGCLLLLVRLNFSVVIQSLLPLRTPSKAFVRLCTVSAMGQQVLQVGQQRGGIAVFEILAHPRTLSISAHFKPRPVSASI